MLRDLDSLRDNDGVILNLAKHLHLETPMVQAMPVNSALIETLTQIILSLSEPERQLLLHQLQDPNPTDSQSLQQKIAIGAQQLRDGDYTEYTDETLPDLLGKIRSRSVPRGESRGQDRLGQI